MGIEKMRIEIERRVREEIEDKLRSMLWVRDQEQWDFLDAGGEEYKKKLQGVITRILSIKGLAILADDQTLPEALYDGYDEGNLRFTEEAVKQDMLKSNFKKVV